MQIYVRKEVRLTILKFMILLLIKLAYLIYV